MAGRRALITGVAGQDGSYLAEWLLEKGYHVAGIDRPGATEHPLIAHLLPERIELLDADLADPSALDEMLKRSRPDEVYHLAGHTFVPASWQDPVGTAELMGLGPVRLMEAIRRVNPAMRLFQASTSEIFGATAEAPQRETTRLEPRNPYGAAKAYAHHMVGVHRRQYGLFVCAGILYNHESPRRPVSFVTRKITDGLARVKLGLADEVRLGSLGARRDWAHARDVVRAMWLMLQADEPDDYIVATGELHTVGEVVEVAAARLGLDWRRCVAVDPAFVRQEPNVLVGDSSKLRDRLGWTPEVSFEALVGELVDADLSRLTAESAGALSGRP